MLSVVTPARNESANLAPLRARLEPILERLGDWEWIIVDDGSTDDTWALIAGWARGDGRIRGARLSRNFGSHAALSCGIGMARGAATVLLVADLQDPPEAIEAMVGRWRDGARIVWGIPATGARFGVRRAFYALLRRGEGLSEQPLEGGNLVLVDRCVADVLQKRAERNSSLFARIRILGFRQDYVHFDPGRRQHGRSAWTLRAKVKLAIDSLTSFDHGLVRAMTYVGAGVAVVGLALAVHVAVNALRGEPPPGWSSLMMLPLLIGGVQMVFLGLLGEYAWRTLDEVRARPLFVVEQTTDDERSQGSQGSQGSQN